MARRCCSRLVWTRLPNWTLWPFCGHFLSKLTDNPPNLAKKATEESTPADVSAVKNDPKYRFHLSSLALLLMGLIFLVQYARELRRQAREARAAKARRLRFKETRMEVEVTELGEGLMYHIFLSHVWGTGRACPHIKLGS